MKKILFICVENSCRSQMAEGLALHMGEGIVEPYSAGSKPSGTVNPDAIKVMQEIGIGITNQKSKSFADLSIREFDYAITLGCQDICPFVPAHKHIEWNIPDPKGRSLDFFRKVRIQLGKKIEKLIKEIK